MKNIHSIAAAAAAAAALFTALGAQASPTAEQIKQLGTTLTPWGAEIAGSKDGSIPPYTGGMSTPPPGFSAAVGKWIDPFAAEKPIVSIDQKNVAQYADKLTPGAQELIRRWPTFRIDVYPSHRTYPAMSAAHAEATIKNATNPECKTVAGGAGIRGCWGGTPFPIPATGNEVMWNHILRERTVMQRNNATNFVVDAAGNRTAPQNYDGISDRPYWDPLETPYKGLGNYYYRSYTRTITPARDSGSAVLIWYQVEGEKAAPSTAWSYSTGQRRTRLAPEFSYDTPITSLGGVLFYDEANMFANRMDRFDFKVVGKKEMIIPYNTIKAVWSPPDQVLGKQFVNPDVERWELHRVWVVEATLKPGQRHAASKRNFYVDEDSWQIMASEGYDQGGKIFRVLLGNIAPNYTGVGGGLADFLSSLIGYDLARGDYTFVSQHGAPNSYFRLYTDRTATEKALFSPEAMAGSGVR